MRLPMIVFFICILAGSAEANPISWLSKFLASSARTAPKLAPSAIPKAGTAIVAGEAASAADDAAKAATRVGSAESSHLADDGSKAAITEEVGQEPLANRAAKKIAEEVRDEAAEQAFEQVVTSTPDNRNENDQPTSIGNFWITEIQRD